MSATCNFCDGSGNHYLNEGALCPCGSGRGRRPQPPAEPPLGCFNASVRGRATWRRVAIPFEQRYGSMVVHKWPPPNAAEIDLVVPPNDTEPVLAVSHEASGMRLGTFKVEAPANAVTYAIETSNALALLPGVSEQTNPEQFLEKFRATLTGPVSRHPLVRRLHKLGGWVDSNERRKRARLGKARTANDLGNGGRS